MISVREPVDPVRVAVISLRESFRVGVGCLVDQRRETAGCRVELPA